MGWGKDGDWGQRWDKDGVRDGIKMESRIRMGSGMG